MNLTDLHTFSLVAETGTISAAARRLGVPKSTISRRVRRLEEALGHELLRRAPRSVALTEHGRVLHKRSAAALRELQAAADALTHAGAEPKGRLRITTTLGFGQSRHIVQCLKTFGLKYPKTTLELELTNRLVNMVEEGFDIGLRLHTAQLVGNPMLMSRRLLEFGKAMYASPEYIAEMGAPATLEALKGHRIAAHSIGRVRDVRWIRNGKPMGRPKALPAPKWLVNDSAALERFVLSGAGLALLSTLEGESWVARGDLVRVVPDYTQQGATASLVWPASRHLAPRVRAFIDHAVETLGTPSGS